MTWHARPKNCLRRSRAKGSRRGGALANVVVTSACLLLLFVLLMPSCGSARETGRQNTCRENLCKLAVATTDYHDLHGHFPGYSNPGTENPFLAHDGTTPAGSGAVSWVAALVELLDHPSPKSAARCGSSNVASATATPTATPTASTSATAAATASAPRLAPSHGFRRSLVCPSDERARRGPQSSYVANCGMPDAARDVSPHTNDRDDEVARGGEGIPRDWPANGIFFDRSDAGLTIAGETRPRRPTVTMRLSMIADRRDATILFSESLNAGPYFFESNDSASGESPERAEIEWGMVWGVGPIESGRRGVGVSAAPRMKPPTELLPPNAERDHAGPATSYRYSRPSSRHPEGFNLVCVGGNIPFIRDTLDYYIYAKLMASDDANAKLPGSETLLDERFRNYQLVDEDLNP